MATQRDKDMKDKENFATQNFPETQESLSPKALKLAEEAAKKVKAEDKGTPNFNVNFISDEVFNKEQAFFPYEPQGESVICIAPKLNIPDSVKSNSLTLSDADKRALTNEGLQHMLPGYRVLRVSANVERQMLTVMQNEVSPQVFARNEFYNAGDYVFSPAAPIREMNFIQPEDTTLSYYEVFHREIRGFMTQEQVLKFKPKEDEA